MAVGVAKLGFPSGFVPQKSTRLPSWKARRCHLPAVRALSQPTLSPLVVEEEGTLAFSEPEARLVEGILGIQGRGRSATPKQLKQVESAVKVLEDLGGVPDPTSSSLIEGRWQLIFTTRPGTASPIQRTFVGVDLFKVFQEIYLNKDDPRVTNIVQFSEAVGELKVEAAATVQDGKRILFRFDRAAFSFKFLPFKVPYPVPFRLLGDEAKGWLDTTYLSHTGNVRISRGNKGTTFVLQKRIEPRQRLLSAISTGIGIQEAIDELVSQNQKGIDKAFGLQEGQWQLIWASQLEGESWSETAASGLKGLQIVGRDGQLENIVSLFPGFEVCARGKLIRSDANNFDVIMSEGFLAVSSFRIPLSIESKFQVKLLYNDKKIRITQGFKQITFVHLYFGETKGE